MSENYPRRRSDISARVVVDETVVLDLGAAQIHQLNATASFIWDRCDGYCTVAAIAEKLTGSFDVDCETAPGRPGDAAPARRARTAGPRARVAARRGARNRACPHSTGPGTRRSRALRGVHDARPRGGRLW